MTAADSHPFLAACRGEEVPYVPVWFMRQAGRALPEYRSARGSGSILDAFRNPELAAELTVQPVRRYGVDAAILFSDIVAPLAAINFGIEITPGLGPVVEEPFRSAADLRRLRPLEPALDVPYVCETVRILASELDVPLIGFAGGPFTIASYLIEGGPSRDQTRTRALMHQAPELWAALMERLADISLAFLRAQVEAGAQAVQLFDSWVGSVSPADYQRFVQPASARILSGLSDLGVPRIHFGVGTGELLELMAEAGADVLGIDWRVPLDRVRRRIAPTVTLQGNLDPAVPLAGWNPTARAVIDILRRGGGRSHIFNLGHGVLPATDPGVLAAVVDLCHQPASASFENL